MKKISSAMRAAARGGGGSGEADHGSIGSDGFEKVLIGTRGPREAFLGGWKGRAAKNSVSASGANTLGPVSPVQLRYEPEASS